MKKYIPVLFIVLVSYFVIPKESFAQLAEKKSLLLNGPHVANFSQLAEYRKAHPKKLRHKDFIEQGEDADENFKFIPGPISGPTHNFNVKIPKGGHVANSPAASIVFNGTQTSGVLIPPDINGAAGNNYVLETTNQQFDIYNKNGTIKSTLDIPTFFSSTPGASYFDPHVRYDAAHQRYIIVSDGAMSNGDGGIFVGVSETPDPTGNWYIYSVDYGVSNSTTLLDYPLVGFNNKWIVVTCNLFANGATFSGVAGFIFNRGGLYSGTRGTVETFTTNAGSFSICPSETNDTTIATEYLVMDYAGDSAARGYVRTFTITGSVNAPVFAPAYFIGVNQPWSENYPGVPQLGNNNTIDEDDGRISNAVYINGSLWFSHTVCLPVNSPTYDGVDWWEINPATASVEQFGRIEDPNQVIFYYYPSINVNNAGNVLVGYSASSTNMYSSAGYSFRASTDALNTMESSYIYKSGLASYYLTFGGDRNRWGDYTGTCVDPVDNSFWTLGEFAALPTNTWGTVIANLGAVPCSGKPAAGILTANSSVICPGDSATLTLSGYATGALGIRLRWQQSSNGATGWIYVNGNDSTSQYVTPSLNATEYYRCIVSCLNSGKSDTTSAIAIKINGIYSSTQDTVCSTGVHKIVAAGGGEINWYLNNATPTALAIGDTLTATISKDTTFYVTSGSINHYKVGPADNTIGTGADYIYFTRGLLFNALTNFTLDTVFIYPGSSGNVQVNLINATTGITADSVIVAIPNSAVGVKTPVRLNMSVQAGTTYDIDANGTTLSSMYRSSSGAVYPYTVTGVVSITDNNIDAAGYYYFFYDWRMHSGCVSARTPVNVIVKPLVVTAKASADSICSGGSVTLTAGGGNTYTWQPGNLPGSSLSVSPTITTTYTVTGTGANGCNGTASVKVKVTSTAKPVITISTPDSTICTGTSISFSAIPSNGGTGPAYQWKVNGVNAGTNGSTFTTSGLTSGEKVSCVLTSDLSCASPSTATSNSITMTVSQLVTPTVTINTANTSVCAGTSVQFTTSVTNGGATPTYQWKNNGVAITGATSSAYTTSGLANGNIITVVLTSDAQCTTTSTATSNSITMTVNPLVTPTVTINTVNASVCAGTSVQFTTSVTNGGATPAYQWKNNGAIITGATSSTYTTTTLANGNIITVVLTSDAQCTTTSTATSNSITMTVNPLATPTVTINTTSTSVCVGTSVVFTTTVTNGGATPAYQWKNNGTAITGATSSTYTTSALANGNIITVVLTSDAQCTTTSTATSNSITMTVNPLVTPTVTINTANTSVCVGTSVVFTTTVTNGGATPSYQWKNNGAAITGATSSTYTTTTLANGNIITVVLTSDAQCTTTSTATSNSITMTVNPLVTPTVTINTGNTIVCAGASVQFTTTVTNGGATPAFQWKNNGAAITGATSSTYTTSALANGNIITVVLTSDAQCTTTSTATSNSITMTVNPLVTPTVTINTANTSVCVGTSVVFTTTVTNGGATPSYQWKNNGVVITGATSSTYTVSTLANGNIITVVLTSDAQCTTTSTATSNSITMTVNPLATPTITINTANTSVCVGTSVVFTTTVTNGGATPAFQWKNNGTAITGATSSTYTTTTLANGNVIMVVLTSDAQCTTFSTANSNSITITVNPLVTPTVTINTAKNSVCSGTSVEFTTTITNGGATPTYQWKNNGIAITGATSSTYTSSTLANANTITAILTSDAQCTTSSTVTSNSIAMTVNPIVAPAITISTVDSNICSGSEVIFTSASLNGGTSPDFQWKKNGVNITGAASSGYNSSSLINNDTISMVMTSDAACITSSTAISNSIVIRISNTLTPQVTISTANTSVCAGTVVEFNASAINGGPNPIYQWMVNGVDSGANNSSFTLNTLVNGDIISCILTTNLVCATKASDTSNSITMTVRPTPSQPVASANSPICEGNALELITPNVADAGFSWTGPDSFVSVLQNPTINNVSSIDSGTYSVEVTVNGCTSSPGTVSVIVNPNPAVPFVTLGGNVLTSNSPTGNQWYLGNTIIAGATQQTYTATQSGWYLVVVTSEGGCSSASDSIDFVPTSIVQVSLDGVVKIVPNPFSTDFNINISNDILQLNSWKINITDELGRIVYENKDVQHSNNVDLGNDASALYFVTILTADDMRTYKVIKQQ